MIYSPNKFEHPKNLINPPSAWKGLEMILADIIERFNVKRNKALEFGVEYGYSTVALSNYFGRVIGVDTFAGDVHTGNGGVDFDELKRELATYPITLVKSDYKDFKTEEMFDLIHVDIVHTYEDTFACGDWSLQHSPIVLFHDTESFPDVRHAVEDLAKKYNIEFHNYPFNNGLGILCRN